MAVNAQIGPSGTGLSVAFWKQLYDDLSTALAVSGVAASSTVTEILAATVGIVSEIDDL